MRESPPQRKLLIGSRLSQVETVERHVLSAVRDAGFSKAEVFAIKLALEEALTNAIKHGNRCDPKKQVTVDFTVSESRFVIHVCDQGEGFAPEQVPDPTLDENLEKPYGRGVMLMRTYMDQVQYNTKGNCVTLVKQRQATQKGRSSSQGLPSESRG